MSQRSGETYMPRSSGLLGGGGLRRCRRRQSAIKGWGKNFPDQMLSSGRAIRELVPDFDPALEFDYTRRELMLIAERILLIDGRDPHADPMFLTASMYRGRVRHEIYTANGTPDPSIVEGMYWRTHPQGRRFSTPELMRTTGCGFYDGVRETDKEIVALPTARPVRSRGACQYPGCDRPVASLGYCQSHYWQQHTGQELRPVGRHGGRSRLTNAQREEIVATRGNGESNATVAERFGLSKTYVGRLRATGA